MEEHSLPHAGEVFKCKLTTTPTPPARPTCVTVPIFVYCYDTNYGGFRENQPSCTNGFIRISSAAAV